MFTVRYIPGMTNQLADCLSHLGNQKDSIKLPKPHVNQITKQLQTRCESLQQLRVATQADDELAILKHTINAGMAQNHQASVVRATTLLDLQRRAYNRRWSHLEGHQNSNPEQAMSSHPKTNTQRPFRTQ